MGFQEKTTLLYHHGGGGGESNCVDNNVIAGVYNTKRGITFLTPMCKSKGKDRGGAERTIGCCVSTKNL